jgi:preprotein translocase subunit SecG
MLSFLHENENKELPEPQKPADTDAKQTQKQDYLTTTGQGKNARRSTMLLAVLFGIGILCLWFMIKKSVPAPAAASPNSSINQQEALIEAAVARLTGVGTEMLGRIDEIVSKFYELSNTKQIQLNELIKNPFIHDPFAGSALDNSDEKYSAADGGQLLMQQAGNMQLLSVMKTGRDNCCMIDDKVLREGDVIKGFKVRQIGSNFVKLEQNNLEIVLKLLE